MRDRVHYGWFVCLAVTVMQLGISVLVTTVASLYVLPMSEKLGCSQGQWMIWMTFYSITYFGSSPLWGSLLQNRRIPFKLLLLGGFLVEVTSLLCFAFCQALWMAYLAGALYGFAQTGIRSSLIPNIASTWFSAGCRGRALGIMHCANGLGGIVLPPIIVMLISSCGPRVSYLASILILAVLCLPSIVFVIERSPEDKMLAPVGYDADAAGREYFEGGVHIERGVSVHTAMKTLPFYLLSAGVFTLAITGAFKRNIAGFAAEFLASTQWASEAAVIAAFCLSIISASDLISNLLIGWLIDKFGLTKTMVAFLCMEPLIYLSWLCFGSNPLGLYAGSLFYGLHGAVLRCALPALVRKVYGTADFSRIFSRIYMWKGLMGGFDAAIFAFTYDLTGTYTYAICFGLVTICFSAVCFFSCLWITHKKPLVFSETE